MRTAGEGGLSPVFASPSRSTASAGTLRGHNDGIALCASRLQLRLADEKSLLGVNSDRSVSKSATIHRFDDSVLSARQSTRRITNYAGIGDHK